MSESGQQNGLIEGWQHLGPVQAIEAKDLFEDPYGKEGFIELRQGCEEVSAGEWIVSSRFAQCSARILINQMDGSVLMKHVGPKPTEVVFGGETGLRPQDEYRDFFEHARQTASAIFAVDVIGGLSIHGLSGDDGPNFDDVELIELPMITVESGGKHTWDIAYNPMTSEVIIKRFNQQDEAIYEKYQLPKVASEEGADSRGRLVRQVERRRLLQRSLEHLGRIPLSSPDFQKIDETRQGIMASGPMLQELTARQLEVVTRGWTHSFVRKAELAERSEDLSPGMQALQILMDATQAAKQGELPHHRRVHALSHLVFSVVIELRNAGSGAIAIGGPELLKYLDSEIASLPASLPRTLRARLRKSSLELRSVSASIIEESAQ